MTGAARTGATCDQQAEDRRLDSDHRVGRPTSRISCGSGCSRPGPIIEKKEWVQFIGSFVILMLGTINVRLAAMRERRRKGLPN